MKCQKKNEMAGENLLHLSKTKQSGRPIFFPISSSGMLGPNPASSQANHISFLSCPERIFVTGKFHHIINNATLSRALPPEKKKAHILELSHPSFLPKTVK